MLSPECAVAKSRFAALKFTALSCCLATTALGQFASHSFEKLGYTDTALQRPDGNIWVVYHQYQDTRDTINEFDVPTFFKTAIVRNNGERISGSDRLLGQGNRFTYPFFSAATQSDNKLLLVSDVAGFIRLNANGSLDTSFRPQTSPYVSIVLQSDGKILVSPDGIRLNPDGSRDPSFVAQLGAGIFSFVGLQTSGKIIVTTDSPPYLKRLNSDGSVDPTFVANLDARVDRTLTLPDNSILIHSVLFNSDGSERFNLIRLNPDGSLDTGFHPDSRFDYWLAVQPDGKVFANFLDPATGNYFLGRMN